MASASVVQVTADGTSRSIQLAEGGISTVSITAESWDVGTVAALLGSTDGRRFSPIRDNGVGIEANENIIMVVEGSGPIRLETTGLGTTVGLELSVSQE